MHESLQGATFHIEHIIPQCQRRAFRIGESALACPGCNLHKAGRITAIDPVTGDPCNYFTPSWNMAGPLPVNGYQIEGLTAVGRATMEALNLNHSRRQRIREVEEVFGLILHPV